MAVIQATLRGDSINDAEKLKSLSFAVHGCNLEMKETDERRESWRQSKV